MPNFFKLTLALLLIAHVASAQTIISGRVTDSVTNAPLADVSIYVVNSTQGTKTDANGNFLLNNSAAENNGLIFHYLGYQTKQVQAAQLKPNTTLNVLMSAKSILLNEVTITYNDDWKKNLRLFRRDFLGTTDTTSCKILNPEVLDIRFNKKQNRLTASMSDFLDIENYLLGYKLRFLVSEFWADYNTQRVHYTGKVIFEELQGSKAENRKWKRNREVVYDLSLRCLLTTIGNGLQKKDGFEVRTLVYTPNPDRPPQNIITAKLKEFTTNTAGKRGRDSLKKWRALNAMPTILDVLGKRRLTGADLIKPGTQPDTYTMQFKDYLYIINKRRSTTQLISLGLKRYGEAAKHEIGTLKMKSEGLPATFTKDGKTINGDNLIVDGYLNSQIIGLLPFDYQPQ